MTVIAYRDGVMAADTEASDSIVRVAGVEKVLLGLDGALYGFAGRSSICSEIMAWVGSGK